MGIQPVAVSVDSPEESRRLCQKAGLSFPVLSDSQAQTTRQYDLLLPADRWEGKEISGPGEFLIDNSGTVRWRKLTEARGAQMLAAAQILQ
jgi:peroxiredoxin